MSQDDERSKVLSSSDLTPADERHNRRVRPYRTVPSTMHAACMAGWHMSGGTVGAGSLLAWQHYQARDQLVALARA